MSGKSEKKKQSRLSRHLGTRTLIQIWRESIGRNSEMGFVVGLSHELVLLHVLDSNHLRLGGYSAFRLKDISSWRVVQDFVAEVVVQFEILPEKPRGIDCTDWAFLVKSAEIAFPLVCVEAERRWPHSLLIGRTRAVNTRSLIMDSVDIHGKWEKPRKFRYRDITRVTFGDGYTLALATVMGRTKGLTHGNE